MFRNTGVENEYMMVGEARQGKQWALTYAIAITPMDNVDIEYRYRYITTELSAFIGDINEKITWVGVGSTHISYVLHLAKTLFVLG